MSAPPDILLPPGQIVVPAEETWEFQEVCDGLAYLMSFVTPAGVPVHAKWELQFDIGATLDLMRVERPNPHAGEPGQAAVIYPVDGVMIGIEAITPTPLAEQKAGGRGSQFDWDLLVNVWRMIGYEQGTAEENSHRRLLQFCKRATKICSRNRANLGLWRNAQRIVAVDMLRWTSVDVHGFGEGADVEIAQGAINVRAREQM